MDDPRQVDLHAISQHHSLTLVFPPIAVPTCTPKMDSSANPSTVGQRSRPAPLAKTTPRLRDIPTSSRFFWRDELQEYLTQRVRDRTHDSTNDRDLPPNEIDCLALNEIAVSEGQGFFFFLPSRVSFSHQTFDPKNRGPSIEDLRYIDHVLRVFVYQEY